MQPVIVDRTAIRTVVEAMLLTYHDAVNPIQVFWDTDDGRDHSRNGSGGGCITLSVRTVAEVGTDRTEFDPVTAVTVHTAHRRFILSMKIESEIYAERDMAIDIAETIRTKSFWTYWRPRWYAAGVSVISAAPVQGATVRWDGRALSMATLELVCLTGIAELDDDARATDYFDTVQGSYQAPQ